MPKQIVRATTEGRNKTRRPRTRWRDKFEGNCDLLKYYVASSGNSLTDVSGQSFGPFLTLEAEIDMLSQNVGNKTTTTRCVIAQKSAVLSYFAVKDQNHSRLKRI